MATHKQGPRERLREMAAYYVGGTRDAAGLASLMKVSERTIYRVRKDNQSEWRAALAQQGWDVEREGDTFRVREQGRKSEGWQRAKRLLDGMEDGLSNRERVILLKRYIRGVKATRFSKWVKRWQRERAEHGRRQLATERNPSSRLIFHGDVIVDAMGVDTRVSSSVRNRVLAARAKMATSRAANT